MVMSGGITSIQANANYGTWSIDFGLDYIIFFRYSKLITIKILFSIKKNTDQKLF